MRNFKYFILVIVLSCTGVAAQVSPTMPPPKRNITAGPSTHHPGDAGRAETTAGTIEGFVYWDANTVRHMPANSCSGLAITVSVGSSSGGPFTVYTPLGTLSNNFKYVGQVKEFLVGGKINVYEVCTYGYDKVPVGPDLQVTLTVAQSGEFLPGAFPQFATLGPIKMVNAQCNMLPRIVNPTASDLGTHWGSCQNMAYDVNFFMQRPPRQPVGLTPASQNNSGSQGGMLSKAPQQGMLSPGVSPSATQAPSNPASQRVGTMPTDRTGSGGTVQLNPQPFPPRQQLTNADVIKMVRAGITESVIVHSIQSSSKEFDFSPASIEALQQAHVSPVVLAAMCDGSAHSCPQGLGNNAPVTPDSIVDLDPQPFPPRTSMTGQMNQGAQASLNPQPLPPGQRLTNADVIKMLRGRVPESVIISSIQSAARNFDSSPSGCRALQQANVTANILKAMADGSVRPCSAGPSSSLGAPSPTVQDCERACAANCSTSPASAQSSGCEKTCHQQCTQAQSTVATRNKVVRPVALKLNPPGPLKKISNPRIAQQNAEIIAVLQQQRQAAQREFAEMKPGVRAAANAVAISRTTLTPNLQGNLTQGIGPETTQDAHGLGSAIPYAPSFNTTVLTCSYDTTPRILRVGGGEAPAVFTPEAKYNLYTIVGCSFGQSQSGNSAYIYGPNGFKANLNIDFWSDNGITAHLDPWLAGVLDQDNVNLVVAPAGRQPLNKPGYKFYAARGMPAPDGSDQEVQLAYDSMPQSRIALFNVSNFLAGVDQLPPNATSSFPSFSFQGTPVAGWVFRYAYEHEDMWSFKTADCFINDAAFEGDPCFQFIDIGYNGDHNNGAPSWQLKSDSWNFGGLAPGFQITSYQLYVSTYDPKTLCGAWDDYRKDAYLEGNWDYNLSPQNQIVVTWPVYRCEADELPPSGRTNRADQSAYGLAVWALGPRCMDPFTGQKDQNCMNKVRTMFS